MKKLLPAVLILASVSISAMAHPDRQWTRMRGGSLGDDWGHGCVADSTGGVYVAGISEYGMDGQLVSGSSDLCLLKYSNTGEHLWTRIWGSSVKDRAENCTLDVYTNLCIAGYTFGAFDGQTNTGIHDMFLTKLNASGTTLWTRIWGSTNQDYAVSCASDSTGAIYTVGYTEGAFGGQTNASIGNPDYCVVKHSASGALLWTRISGSSRREEALDCAVDSTGALYVVGWSDGSFGGQTNCSLSADTFVAKYSPNGTRLWIRFHGNSWNDLGQACAVDLRDNSLYVAGYVVGELAGQTNAGRIDASLTKFSSDGTPLWTRLWGSETNDYVSGCAIDPVGGVYVSGYTESSFGGAATVEGFDMFITKFKPDGTLEWSNVGGSEYDDFAYNCAVGPRGDLYITGGTESDLDDQTNTLVETQVDMFLVKVNIDVRHPTLVWKTNSLSWYQIWMNRNGTLYNKQWLNQTNGSWTVTNDYKAGSYTWWSRSWASNLGYSAWVEGTPFTVPNLTPGKVNILTPWGSQAGATRFYWEKESLASWYNLYVSRNESRYLSTLVQEQTNYVVGADIPYGVCKWWVRGWNVDGYGPWSSSMVFTNGVCGQAVPVGVSGSARPLFAWQAINGATWYRLYILRDGGTAISQWVKGTTNWTPTTDLASGNYSWWVLPYNSTSGSGPWSEGLDFSIP